MTVEQVIEQILAEHPDVSKDAIAERLKQERQKTNGFISDETLLRMIAAEFGTEIENDHASMPTLSTADLIPNLNDITIIGRVVAVFPVKAFNGRRSGKLASFLIADKDGILRVVLWNDKVSLIETGEIKVGQVTRVCHGYTKEGRGQVELHVGEKSRIEIDSKDMDLDQFPTIDRFMSKIAETTRIHGNGNVNIAGTVRKVFPISTFKRQDLSTGKVMRFLLADSTGEISVVAWNDRVDELGKMLEREVSIRIVNGKLKRTVGKESEVHVDAGAFVEIIPAVQRFCRIADLKENLNHADVEGTVVTAPSTRDVRTSKQEVVKLASFELKDETGRIWVSAWRQHAVTVSCLKVGDKIVMKDACVRRGFGDQLEISMRDSTSLAIGC